MKTKAFFLLWLLILAGCAQPSPIATTAPTANVQATVDAGIAATQTALAAAQVTIDAAVKSTVAALPPTATPVPPVDEVTLSEEELAALIDEAVNEAVTASTTTTTTAAQVAEDGTVSEDDVETLLVTLAASEQAIAYAEELITAYQDLYGEYADEALASLDQIEQDLEVMAQSMEEISAILTQGSQQATAALEQLNTSLAAAQAQAEALQAQSAGWIDQVQAGLEARSGEVMNRPPDQIAGDLPATIDLLHAYTGAVRTALEDNRVTPSELDQIALLSSNALASLNQNGGELAKKLGDPLAAMTANLARGQWPQARSGLDAFEREIPNIASRRP